MKKQTRHIEAVEAHNIALSLKRINGTSFGSRPWKRALYHALGLSGVAGDETLKAVREAPILP
jgi:hypothetical protein